MTTLETPQFSNSCGKIFADKIVLASAHKETEVPLHELKKVSFTSRPLPKSLFFIALPAVLFAFPFVTNEKDWFVNAIFIAIGLILMGVSLFNVNKKHTLSLKLATGNSVSINVWEGNLKEAKKFANMIDAKITRR
ncbi:hypothetical protein [Flavobacterium akiainvivens]|nr:hypothetical protein [Flavobacterium akiainvivens]SFQ77159.1 hypothetical protein SAMN05444144_12524 [Flavobacterium akiainvivens]